MSKPDCDCPPQWFAFFMMAVFFGLGAVGGYLCAGAVR
jgi:hypothetical protein